MAESPASDNREAQALAARLRMLFADSVGQHREARGADLLAEIEHAVAEAPAHDRAGLIRDVLASLPGWEAALAVGGEAAGDPTTRDAELRDPGFLVERLEEIADGLSDAQREAIALRLGAAGLVPSAGSATSPAADGNRAAQEVVPVSDQQADRLSSILRAEGRVEIDPERLLELCLAMADLVTKLDQLAWSTWRAMSPRSDFKRRMSAQEAMRRYLSGDPAVPREQVADEIERLRRLAGALISTVAKVGFVAYRQVAKNAPSEIEVLAKPEKKAFESLEVACWRKYRQLAGNLDQALVEAEVLSSLSDSIEALVRGVSRSNA